MKLHIVEIARDYKSGERRLYKLSDNRIVDIDELERIADCVYATIALRIKKDGLTAETVLDKTIKKGTKKPNALVKRINHHGVDTFIGDNGHGYTVNSLSRILKRDRGTISLLIQQYGFDSSKVLETKTEKIAESQSKKQPFSGSLKRPTWWERNFDSLPTFIDPRY